MPSVLLIAPTQTPYAAEQAIADAGGRLLDRIGWQAMSHHAKIGDATALLAIAADVPPADIDAALAGLDALATAHAIPLVVVLEEPQIDQVAAQAIGPRVELLCAPSPAELVATLALAAQPARPATSVRESDGARFARLSEDAARIAEVLARLGREAQAAADQRLADRRAGFGFEPAPDDLRIAASDIRAAIRARRLRDRFFGEGWFEDPAWDMLLDLFAAELERAQVSVSSLCIAAAVAPTTALRWIARLTDAGLLAREADPFDRRRAYLRLSESALAGMRGYVAAVRAAGLAIA